MAPGEPVLWSLYVYAPNKTAPIIFAALYGVSAALHIWQCIRYKAWRLIGLHPLCAVLFTAGYALRAYSANGHYLFLVSSSTPLVIFVVGQIFVYVGPPLLELANYHVLGRVFYYVPHCAPYPPRRVLSTFGALMAVVELLNALGVSLATNSSSSAAQQTTGGNMTVAAVALQIFVILVFVVLSAIFHRRFLSRGLRSESVTTSLYTLYLSMALILVRCIYRLVEHTGHTVKDINDMESLRQLSPLIRYETFFYIFEAALMLLNSALWNIWHPGRFLPHDHCVFLDRNGREVVGKETPDDRSLAKKIGHIASFGILYGRKRELQGFHELTENVGPPRQTE